MLNTPTSYIVVALVSFFLGAGVGYIVSAVFIKKAFKIQANTLVLVSVVMVWTLSMIIEFVNPAYKTSPLVHGLMGAIVGFFFKPWVKNETTKP